MKIQALASALAASLALLCVAAGAEAQVQPATGGFYGGVSLRQAGTEGNGVSIGAVSSTWGRYTDPVGDDTGKRALFFGGYRWANDVSVEASLATSDRYSLQAPSSSGRTGVGLSLMPAEPASHAWNADVYTSWSFLRRFSLYGRLGYAQSDTAAGPLLSPVDVRRRDGVNYGLGLRYDINRALGLRVEYARFNHFANELQGGVLPESDQVQLGVQLRF